MRSLTAALLLFLATTASADVRYVDDTLVITMRTGQGTSFQILKTLPSGTPMELLEEDGKYSLVRTEDGTEGWVLSQYLSDTPIARYRLERAEQQIAQLKAQKKSLQQRLAQTAGERDAIAKTHREISRENEQLREELDRIKQVARRPIELAQENRQLREQLDELQSQSNKLQADNIRLQDRSQRDWFITGAAVLAGGILLGLVLPMLRRRRKSGMFD